MKRRLIICSSLITIILSCFSFPIFAEETVQDSSTIHTLSDGVFLDSYFYDNYDPLPYIQSNGNQYLDTGINGSNDLRVNLVISDLDKKAENLLYPVIFGSRDAENVNQYSLSYRYSNNQYRFSIYESSYSYQVYLEPYSIYDILIDHNDVYFNNNLIFHNTLNEFENSYPMYIFGLNATGVNNANLQSVFKLYKFSIYDYSADDGNGAYVRYYYPAKSKSGGVIGLYDAVNKTFIGSSTVNQFSNPTNEYVENFQISSFLSASLGWIGQIFTAIIDMPIIIIFMAIGLAGAMFRWGRRIVHF